MFWNHVTPSEDEVWRSRLENPCPFSDKQCKKSTILRICEMGNPGKEKKRRMEEIYWEDILFVIGNWVDKESFFSFCKNLKLSMKKTAISSWFVPYLATFKEKIEWDHVDWYLSPQNYSSWVDEDWIWVGEIEGTNSNKSLGRM